MTVQDSLKNVTIVVRQARLNAEEHEALQESLRVLGKYAQKGLDAELAAKTETINGEKEDD